MESSEKKLSKEKEHAMLLAAIRAKNDSEMEENLSKFFSFIHGDIINKTLMTDIEARILQDSQHTIQQYFDQLYAPYRQIEQQNEIHIRNIVKSIRRYEKEIHNNKGEDGKGRLEDIFLEEIASSRSSKINRKDDNEKTKTDNKTRNTKATFKISEMEPKPTSSVSVNIRIQREISGLPDMPMSLFQDIAETPVYLPLTFPDILSGEYILYLQYGGDLHFRRERVFDTEYGSGVDLNDEEIFRRIATKFFRGKDCTKKQFERRFHIQFRLSGSMPQEKENDIWTLFEMYEFVKYMKAEKLERRLSLDENSFIRIIRNHLKKKRTLNTRPLFSVMDTPYFSLFDKGRLDSLTDDEKKLLLFQTLIFQQLSDEQQNEVMFYRIYSRKNIHGILGALRNIPVLLASKHVIENSLQSVDEIMQHDCCRMKQAAQNLKVNKAPDISIAKPSEAGHVVLWRILALQNKSKLQAGLRTIRDLVHPYTECQQTFLQQHESLNMMGTTKWTDFFQTYEAWMEILFPDEENSQLEKIWRIAVKVILYCYPERFAFPLYSERTDQAWIDKSPKDEWYLEHGVRIDKIQINELIPMMTLVMSGKEVEFKLYPGIRHGTMWYKVFDNIRSYAGMEVMSCIRMLIAMQHQMQVMTREDLILYDDYMEQISRLVAFIPDVSFDWEKELYLYQSCAEWLVRTIALPSNSGSA